MPLSLFAYVGIRPPTLTWLFVFTWLYEHSKLVIDKAYKITNGVTELFDVILLINDIWKKHFNQPYLFPTKNSHRLNNPVQLLFISFIWACILKSPLAIAENPIMVHAIIITDQPFNDPIITLQLSHVGIAVLIVEITPTAGVMVMIGRRRKLIIQWVNLVHI